MRIQDGAKGLFFFLYIDVVPLYWSLSRFDLLLPPTVFFFRHSRKFRCVRTPFPEEIFLCLFFPGIPGSLSTMMFSSDPSTDCPVTGDTIRPFFRPKPGVEVLNLILLPDVKIAVGIRFGIPKALTMFGALFSEARLDKLQEEGAYGSLTTQSDRPFLHHPHPPSTQRTHHRSSSRWSF